MSAKLPGQNRPPPFLIHTPMLTGQSNGSTCYVCVTFLKTVTNIPFVIHNSLVPTTTFNHNMQVTNRPNNESSCSQCNLTATLCCGERASTLNEELITRGVRGESEKSALYNITCLGESLVPFPTFNLFNQSLKKGCFNTTNRAP